jgi:hypothetical protein
MDSSLRLFKIIYLGPFDIIPLSKACRNGQFFKRMVKAETTVGDMTFLQQC